VDDQLPELLKRAKAYLTQGNLLLARDTLRAAFVLAPESSQIAVAYGNVLLQLGEVEAARRAFVQSTVADPADILGHINVATSSWLLGERDQALAALQRAQQLDPHHPALRPLLDTLQPQPAAKAPAAPPLVADFDEAFYLRAYPDVAKAVRAGQFRSGREHFERYGRAENRRGAPEAFERAAPVVVEFLNAFFARLFEACYQYEDRVWDTHRFGPEPELSPAQRQAHEEKRLLAQRGLAARHFELGPASQALTRIVARQAEFASVYHLLADTYSRSVFLDLLAFRALGARHVRLPVNTEAYWRNYDGDARFIDVPNTLTTATGWQLNRYEVAGRTGPLRLNLAALTYFSLLPYAYRHDGIEVTVQPNDIVIDGGGCWGEMAFHFADLSAPLGKVYSFEFDPDNLKVFQSTAGLNPRLAGRVEVVESALHEVTGQVFTFEPNGPGTSISRPTRPAVQVRRVETMNLDDFVKIKGLPAINFIKMDIEGSELLALRGAKQTLLKDKPTLAISVYHQPDDIITIPQFLNSLGVGYRFYLDHFTVHAEETVLFATCRP
jgi:FkbM family methyltransferase